MAPSREVLVIHGRLDRAGRFTPRRCRSTPNVREWPIVHNRDTVVELLDRSGKVLHREPALVKPVTTCDPGDAQRFRVIGYIELRNDAAVVRLMRGDLELWRSTIPGPATLDLKLARTRTSRATPVRLGLRYSSPGRDAHVTVVYQWGARRFRPIYIGRPKREIAVDLRDLPGGDECRLVVTYSNGLRSAHAATEPFRVPRLGPSVNVVRPDARTPITARTPVILEGTAFDPEREGGPKAGDLTWLIDGQEVATGLIASVDGLRAGRHRVTLAYRGNPGAESTTNVKVVECEVPTANDWPEWDPIAGNN